MRRNALEVEVKDYLSQVIFKKITPLLLWCQCDKCRDEFRREEVYRMEYPIYSWSHYLIGKKYGCSHCFANMEEFKKYCFKEYLEEDIGYYEDEWIEEYLDFKKSKYKRCEKFEWD